MELEYNMSNKIELSDIIFEVKESMTDLQYKRAMELISLLREQQSTELTLSNIFNETLSTILNNATPSNTPNQENRQFDENNEPINRLDEEGKKHGRYIYYYDDDIDDLQTSSKQSEGIYNNGFKNGVWIGYFRSSGETSSITTYKNGKLHGIYQQFYINGQLKMTSNFKDDQEDGESKMYYEDGQLQSEEYYRT